MKIAFYTCHFPPDSMGGAQMQSHRLSDALGRRNEVIVFVRDYKGNKRKVEKVGNYTIIRRKVTRFPVLRSIFDYFNSLFIIFKSKDSIDVFLSFHSQLSSLIIITAKLLFQIKTAISPRGEEDFDFKSHKKLLQKFLFKNSNSILIQSDNIKSNFLEKISNEFNSIDFNKIKNKIYLFPNGIDVCVNHHEIKIKNNLIYVGRLIDYKGVEYLIAAVKLLTENCKLIIVGDGPDRKRLEKLAEGSNIEFTGTLTFEEISKLLLASKIFILPSLTENLPNVILEALSFGLPVISTPVGAIPEIIKNGKNGYLVEKENPEQIYEKIKLILENKELYFRLATGAMKSVSVFSWDYLLPKLEKQLQNIIDNA